MLSRLKFNLDSIIDFQLSLIPDSIWQSTTTTFADFDMAGGQYIAKVVDKLRKFGHSDANIKSRVYGFSERRFCISYVHKKIGEIATLDIYTYRYNNMKFNCIVGNPPYQKQVGPSKTEPLWHKFVQKAFDNCEPDGYVALIHPSGWRVPGGRFSDIKDLYYSKQMQYLSVNDFKKGQKTFGVGTNFDWSVTKNSPNDGSLTTIVDTQGEVHVVDIAKMPLIPNGAFDKFEKLVAKDGEETVEMLHAWLEYEIRMVHMSPVETPEFKYPCVYTITQRDGVNLWYSSLKKGHFGIPKVIWSNGLGTYPIVDAAGEYAMTQFAYAIADVPENLPLIKKAMESAEFLSLMKMIKFTNNIYDYRVISLFRKDFWKEFV